MAFEDRHLNTVVGTIVRINQRLASIDPGKWGERAVWCRIRLINRGSLDAVVLDTTVEPMAIAHPTDSRLVNKAREQLVDAAQDAGIMLRQGYSAWNWRSERQPGRHPHTKQCRRMQREIRNLRTKLGHLIRNLHRKGGETTGAQKNKIEIHSRSLSAPSPALHPLADCVLRTATKACIIHQLLVTGHA